MSEKDARKKILIVEDELSIAELEKDYLEINGFTAIIASTGQKGLDLLKEEAFDLVILDVMLPEINGFDFLKIMRDTYDIPVLMVTARKEDIDKIRGLGLGADDYITKPFSPGELVARVKSHLSRYERLVSRTLPAKNLIIGGLQIDIDARRVLFEGEEIVLTNKEYDLLIFLASNPDKVFSKEILLERIWGYDHYGDSATVTVHIGKLREKIPCDLIETIWGAGYRFNI